MVLATAQPMRKCVTGFIRSDGILRDDRQQLNPTGAKGVLTSCGQIVAGLIDRKSTLKTFVLKNGKPFLKAENPKYPDLIPSEELMIQGVVRAVLRQLEK